YKNKGKIGTVGRISGLYNHYIYVEGATYYPSELMLVRSAEAGANPATSSSQTQMEDTHMTSTSLVGAAAVAPTTTKRRRDLKMGDLFRNVNGGKIYMHTGVRTAPPSGTNTVRVTVGGNEVYRSTDRNLGYAPNGDVIVGFQSIVVRGKVSPGQDGAVVTFDGDKEVVYLGRAAITLPSGV